MIPYPLSSPDKTVPIILNEAVAQTLSRLSIDPTLMKDSTVFLLELVGETFLYSFLTIDGIQHYRNRIFTNANARDLVFSVYSSFIGRYGGNDDELEELQRLIARAATVSSGGEYSEITPDELSTRMMSYEDILMVLRDNPWIVCVSLILLYWNQGVTMTQARG